VRYGIHLSASGPLATPERIAALAERAEALGFDSVWVSDHVAFPVGFQSVYPYGPPSAFTQQTAHYYEPLVTLAWVAGRTRRVRLGTSVLVVPMRNPVYLAKQAATLDRLAGGRLILGVGAGWQREEFEALGVTTFAQRGAVLDEWIRLMRRLWTEEVVEFSGAFYQVGPIIVNPKPAQPGGPPILVGGNGPRALRRAAELGDGWHAIRLSVAEVAAGASRLRALAEAAGREPGSLEVSLRVDAAHGEAAGGPEEWWIQGAAPAAAERVRQYRQAGCGMLLFGLTPATSAEAMSATMEWLAGEVLPAAED